MLARRKSSLGEPDKACQRGEEEENPDEIAHDPVQVGHLGEVESANHALTPSAVEGISVVGTIRIEEQVEPGIANGRVCFIASPVDFRPKVAGLAILVGLCSPEARSPEVAGL